MDKKPTMEITSAFERDLGFVCMFEGEGLHKKGRSKRKK